MSDTPIEAPRDAGDAAPGTSELPRALSDRGARPASSREAVLRAVDIRKSFEVGERQLEVLHGVDLELFEGERLGLMGSSGAGKSTLMHILGLLEEPSEGEVWLDDVEAWRLSAGERAHLRNTKLAFVFQFYHLLPELTAVENVLLPAMIRHSRMAFGGRAKEFRERSKDLLVRCGLERRLDHRPSQLSGGEQQRVAIARALFQEPLLIIADEPTGNLDSATGKKVLELLFEQQESLGLSLLIVTHDERVAAQCSRVLYMADGVIRGDSSQPLPH